MSCCICTFNNVFKNITQSDFSFFVIFFSASAKCWYPGFGTDWNLFQPRLHPDGLREKAGLGQVLGCGQAVWVQCVWPSYTSVLPIGFVERIHVYTELQVSIWRVLELEAMLTYTPCNFFASWNQHPNLKNPPRFTVDVDLL